MQKIKFFIENVVNGIHISRTGSHKRIEMGYLWKCIKTCNLKKKMLKVGELYDAYATYKLQGYNKADIGSDFF